MKNKTINITSSKKAEKNSFLRNSERVSVNFQVCLRGLCLSLALSFIDSYCEARRKRCNQRGLVSHEYLSTAKYLLSIFLDSSCSQPFEVTASGVLLNVYFINLPDLHNMF